MVFGLQTQPKSWLTGYTFWVNHYLEIVFSKISVVNPPPPLKGSNEFKEREDNLKKELEEYKNSSQTSINEMESYYQGQIKLLQEKIKSMGENKASFKPLSDAIFNCITIEEIFKIRKLVRNREFDVLVKNHLDTLHKLFLSLTYGVIPMSTTERCFN